MSFSGGRDSSMVLALAIREARAHGLADPIPVTLRFPKVPRTEESAWQERVIAQVGAVDWQRVELEDELDFLGPIATGNLAREGLLWPPNSHFHGPIFERAAGGSVLTGFDGDGLLGSWRWERAQAALHRLVPFEIRDPLRILLAFSPAGLRQRVIGRRGGDAETWLRPGPWQELASMLVAAEARQPARWDRWLETYVRDRFVRLPIHSLGLLGARYDVRVVHPQADARFVAALARDGGAAGYGPSERARRVLFGDLLPDEIITRKSKAEFGYAFWGPHARAFVENWDGSGVDADLVDPDDLRAVWSQPNPPFAAATLLQAAWLEAKKRRREELSPRQEPT